MRRPRAVVAMSGGVDSSVAAALLLQKGYRVEGVSLRLWDSERRDDRVCSDHRDAAQVAKALGIAHTEIDQREAFERTVVAPFVAEYARGRTPNPCVACTASSSSACSSNGRSAAVRTSWPPGTTPGCNRGRQG